MTKLLWPLPDDCRQVTSAFGPRIHPVTGAARLHSGIDIACPSGTPVMAPDDGIVTAVWVDARHGGGLSLTLQCSLGLRFGFAHLQCQLVMARQTVRRGELLALSGGIPGTANSGTSTGPHLHLTCRQHGQRVDPLSLDWEDSR